MSDSLVSRPVAREPVSAAKIILNLYWDSRLWRSYKTLSLRDIEVFNKPSGKRESGMVCLVLRDKLKKNKTFCLIFLLEKVSLIGKGFAFWLSFIKVASSRRRWEMR